MALHAWLESLQRLQGRKSAPEVITAARAVREMQDAVAALAQNDDRGPRPLRP